MDVSRRVIIVDDSPLVLKSLSSMVRGCGFTPVPIATLAAAKELILQSPGRPDAALVDLVFAGGRSGLEVVDVLWGRYSSTLPTAIVTGAPKSLVDELLDTWRASTRPSVLAKPITSVQLRPFLVSASAVSSLHHSRALRAAVIGLAERLHLTPQESRIVGQLAAGSTRSALAADVRIDSNTVKWHMKRLLRKARVPNTDGLISEIFKAVVD